MKNIVKKAIQIEIGGMVFPGSIQIIPSISIHRGQRENYFGNYFAINIERIVFAGRIQFETTKPRTPKEGETICSFTSKKL